MKKSFLLLSVVLTISGCGTNDDQSKNREDHNSDHIVYADKKLNAYDNRVQEIDSLLSEKYLKTKTILHDESEKNKEINDTSHETVKEDISPKSKDKSEGENGNINNSQKQLSNDDFNSKEVYNNNPNTENKKDSKPDPDIRDDKKEEEEQKPNDLEQEPKQENNIESDENSFLTSVQNSLPNGYEAKDGGSAIDIYRGNTLISSVNHGGMHLLSLNDGDIKASINSASALGADPEIINKVINEALNKAGVSNFNGYQAYKSGSNEMIVTYRLN